MKIAKFRRTWATLFPAALFLLVSLLTSGAQAQTANTGAITGVVKDQTGAVVPGATVTATNVGTNAARSTTTSDEGV